MENSTNFHPTLLDSIGEIMMLHTIKTATFMEIVTGLAPNPQRILPDLLQGLVDVTAIGVKLLYSVSSNRIAVNPPKIIFRMRG
jgi:hypothetical protein